MENAELRIRFNAAMDSFINKVIKSKKCLAAFLFGSTSHDLIWEWSDLQILLIYEDGFKWPGFSAIEHDIYIAVCIRHKTEFLEHMASAGMMDLDKSTYSKSTPLFIKDPIIQECFDDMLYIGEKDKEAEMIKGFYYAVWCMNKAEKNFYIKKNLENTVFFLLQAAEHIARIEIAKHQQIIERECIAQAKKLNPELFKWIYDRMIYEVVTEDIAEEILKRNLEYLKSNTEEVYRPVLDYLREHGNLDKFSMPTVGHRYNLLWLYRMGILERKIEPVKVAGYSEDFYKFKYVLKDGGNIG